MCLILPVKKTWSQKELDVNSSSFSEKAGLEAHTFTDLLGFPQLFLPPDTSGILAPKAR